MQQLPEGDSSPGEKREARKIARSGVIEPSHRSGGPGAPPGVPVDEAQPQRQPWALLAILIIAALLIVIAGGLWLYRNLGSQVTMVISSTATPIASAQPSGTTAITRTATLPTISDARAQLATDNEAGIKALLEQRYAEAEARLRRVFNYAPDYPDVRRNLAATYYSWGIALLNSEGDAAQVATNVQEALGKFEAARAVALPDDPTQQLASDWRALVMQYQAAMQNPTQPLETRVPQFEALLTNQNDPQITGPFFASIRKSLYRAYVERAKELLEQAKTQESETKWLAASDTYKSAAILLDKASGLDVPDKADLQALRTQVQERTQAVAAILTPTAAPKPTLPPLPPQRTFVVQPIQGFNQGGNTGKTSSCVGGYVLQRGGNGVAGAVVEVDNGKGVHASNVSGSGGLYKICGLGADRWTVVLVYIPGNRPLAAQPSLAFEVNGEGYQAARVNFIEH